MVGILFICLPSVVFFLGLWLWRSIPQLRGNSTYIENPSLRYTDDGILSASSEGIINLNYSESPNVIFFEDKFVQYCAETGENLIDVTVLRKA